MWIWKKFWLARCRSYVKKLAWRSFITPIVSILEMVYIKIAFDIDFVIREKCFLWKKRNTQTQSVGVCAAPLLECIGNNFIAKIQVHSTSSIYKRVPKWKTLEMPFHLWEIHLPLATTRIQRLLTVQTLISKDSTIQQEIIFFPSI